MPHRLVLVIVSLLTTTVSQAQLPSVRADSAVRNGVVTFNPFAAFIVGYVAGDVEVKSSPVLTLGGGVSLVNLREFGGYRAYEAKARYYPGEHAPRGFSIGGAAGFASADDESNRDVDGQRVATSRNTRPTIATEFSYQWLLAPSSRFVAVAGLGLKRFLGSRSDRRNPINDGVLPTARLNIGIAF